MCMRVWVHVCRTMWQKRCDKECTRQTSGSQHRTRLTCEDAVKEFRTKSRHEQTFGAANEFQKKKTSPLPVGFIPRTIAGICKTGVWLQQNRAYGDQMFIVSFLLPWTKHYDDLHPSTPIQWHKPGATSLVHSCHWWILDSQSVTFSCYSYCLLFLSSSHHLWWWILLNDLFATVSHVQGGIRSIVSQGPDDIIKCHLNVPPCSLW